MDFKNINNYLNFNNSNYNSNNDINNYRNELMNVGKQQQDFIQ